MAPNIFDVARKAGVSYVTVSKVLNNNPSVRPQNRDKVLKAMAELDYSPNMSARGLALGKTKQIGLLVPGLFRFYHTEILAGIEGEASENGYSLSFIATEQLEVEKATAMAKEGRVDGFITVTPTREEELFFELKRLNLPVVFIECNRELDAPRIIVEDYKAAYKATSYLHDLGHRKVGFIAGESKRRSSQQRLAGYRQACLDRGLENEIHVFQGSYVEEAGYNALNAWLQEGYRPTAVLAANDLVAAGLMIAARRQGIMVPDDLSVIGFDDTIAQYCNPPLTTVRQPMREIGKASVTMLISLLRGEPLNQQVLVFESELIIRESTAINKSTDSEQSH